MIFPFSEMGEEAEVFLEVCSCSTLTLCFRLHKSFQTVKLIYFWKDNGKRNAFSQISKVREKGCVCNTSVDFD